MTKQQQAMKHQSNKKPRNIKSTKQQQNSNASYPFKASKSLTDNKNKPTPFHPGNLSLKRSQCNSIICVSSFLLPRELKFNKLELVPNLKHCRELRLLNLASNYIVSLHNQPFKNLEQLHDLSIQNNQIETIPLDTFTGLKRLQTL
jgi:hypothetical protein